ncbi:MAG: glycosyltransferase family 39 protein, partial [Myxococcota bacterium]
MHPLHCELQHHRQGDITKLNPPDRNTDPAQQNFGADSERTRRESSTVQASRKTLWAVAIVCVVAASFWVSGRQDLPFVFLSGDERNYAEIGRRVATGRGFTTGVIYPIEVDWGVDEAHPSLLRPPLWPLVLAGAFTLGSADEVTAHLVVGLCFVITCLLTYAIGASLRGPLVGLIAGVTAAATPMFSKYAMLAGTEMLLALWIALATLLFVRKANPFWIGCVCGLAYLSRYNAGVLLIASLLFLPANRPRWKPYALCLAGFVLACAPWWLRNAVVTGNPFFSLYTSTLWAGPGLLPGKVLWMLDPPDVSIMHPLMRAYDSMAPALAAWPVPASNLVAFIGLVLGCVYLSRPHLFLGVALLMSKLAVTLVILNNRYLVPFVPSMIALGSAAWVLYGGRIGR